MTSYNAANERMKRQYFAYLAEAQGHSEQTIDAVAIVENRQRRPAGKAMQRRSDVEAFDMRRKRPVAHRKQPDLGSFITALSHGIYR
jgi:hypothetical protein